MKRSFYRVQSETGFYNRSKKQRSWSKFFIRFQLCLQACRSSILEQNLNSRLRLLPGSKCLNLRRCASNRSYSVSNHPQARRDNMKLTCKTCRLQPLFRSLSSISICNPQNGAVVFVIYTPCHSPHLEQIRDEIGKSVALAHVVDWTSDKRPLYSFSQRPSS